MIALLLSCARSPTPLYERYAEHFPEKSSATAALCQVHSQAPVWVLDGSFQVAGASTDITASEATGPAEQDPGPKCYSAKGNRNGYW